MNSICRFINAIRKNAIKEVLEIQTIVKVTKKVSPEVLSNYAGVQS